MKTVVHRIALEVLTPVHVGTGESVNAMGYLRTGDTLHVVGSDRWAQWILDQGKANLYLQWMEEELARIMQKERNTARLTQFVTDRLRQSDVGAVAQKVSRYAVQLEQCGEPDPTDGFRTHVRDAQYRPYLPGSSIKGAIRTALLEDRLLDGSRLETELLKPLQRLQPDNDRRALRRALRQQWQRMEQNLLRGGKPKANFDLLRFVLVSDSEPVELDGVSVRLVRSEGTGRTTDTWVEALRVGTVTHVMLSFTPEAPLGLLGLDESLRDLLRIERLFMALYERAQRRLERELQYPYLASVKQAIRQLQERNRPDAPLLCVGWGQGYLGTTVMGLARDEKPEEYAELIEKMKPALPRRSQNVEAQRFPKTRRAVRDSQKQAVAPPGWVQMRVEGG